MKVILPQLLLINESPLKNPIVQVGQLAIEIEGNVTGFSDGRRHGHLIQSDYGEVLVVAKGRKIPEGRDQVVIGNIDPSADFNDLSEASWFRHPLLTGSAGDRQEVLAEVLSSWRGRFHFVVQNAEADVVGLRPPQLGALHAILGHWASSDEPATVVMPTGVGKTDTMIASLVSIGCPRVLVLVPSDVLRSQLGSKFANLGVLRTRGSDLLDEEALFPVVCQLKHVPRTMEEVDETVGSAQVVITTSAVAARCKGDVQARIAELCPYLFIDEAHHAPAPTWAAFAKQFADGRVLQFTATPFREDGKPLDGRIVFKYPLRRALEEGYFRPIRFKPVMEFNPTHVDEAIALRAVEQLREDIEHGHIVMSRVASVSRAAEVHAIYRAVCPEFNPVQLHTGLSPAVARETRERVISGESRVVVCVDMLGEGFDLPELKIAAFHDIRKSLAVTLQLAGRFTRARADLGDPTFIANTADVEVHEELQALYGRDPDWNALLPEYADAMVGEQVALQEFLDGFAEAIEAIPLISVKPAMSAVVYETTCETWNPSRAIESLPNPNSFLSVQSLINEAERVLVVVGARRSTIEWTDAAVAGSIDWELYVLHWSEDQNLLFINSSGNKGEYGAIARAVCGNDASLISGQRVFRVFAGVGRLQLQNVGLTEHLGRNVRYTGRMGADVESGLTEEQKQRASKSVLAGTGYEGGQKTTVGASRKGRIWSHRRDHLEKFVTWCADVGAALLDERLDPEKILKGTLESRVVGQRPLSVPVGVDWPEEVYTTPENKWQFVFGDLVLSLAEVDIELTDLTPDGPLQMRVGNDTVSSEFQLSLTEVDDAFTYLFERIGGSDVLIRAGERGTSEMLGDYFDKRPPIIWFADGSSLEGNRLVELPEAPPAFDRDRILGWDWADLDITQESQGVDRDPNTIQAHLIRQLLEGDFAVVFDDDASGEAADVIAVTLEGDDETPDRIVIDLYHCKYSGDQQPGARIGDLYEVCGQAQKSIKWMASHKKRFDLFTHLLRRESLRQTQGKPTRFERGDVDLLETIRQKSSLYPVVCRVFIVQPGLSKKGATEDQLRLLGVTAHYLSETYQLPLIVIASA